MNGLFFFFFQLQWKRREAISADNGPPQSCAYLMRPIRFTLFGRERAPQIYCCVSNLSRFTYLSESQGHKNKGGENEKVKKKMAWVGGI